MGSEILLPYSEDPNNGSYPEWVQYCNVLEILYSRWNFIALQKSIHYC
jgi:hypothetical protein